METAVVKVWRRPGRVIVGVKAGRQPGWATAGVTV